MTNQKNKLKFTSYRHGQVCFSMLIDEESAKDFVYGYSILMFAVENIDPKKSDEKPSAVILRGREKFSKDPQSLEKAIAQLSPSVKNRIAPDVIDAVRFMEVSTWVYLKETRWYSVFIKSDKSSAVAILGLNTNIREICGGSGVVFKAGVTSFRNNFISDGLFEKTAYLGNNYKSEYSEAFEKLKRENRFFKKPKISMSLIYN